MKRRKKWLAYMLIAAFMLPLVAPFITLLPGRTAAEELDFGNAHITPYQNKDANGNVEGPPTVRYAIAFMSIDLWRNSSGVWSPLAPGQSFGYGLLEWPYNFSFTDRTVRDYEVFLFNRNNPEHVEFFNNSRAGTQFEEYKDYLSSVSQFNVVDSVPGGGRGTNTASFMLKVAGTLSGKYISLPCDNGQKCNPPVEGRRYYFPIGFKFELDGQKRVRLFDSTTGKRIEYQGTTADMISGMEKGKSVVTEVPQISGYRYVGYKKKTYMTYWPGGNYGEPEGEIIPGPPPSFVYDGSFDTYIVHLYYEPDTAPQKPDLVAVDITANGPIEVGKPVSFTAKWRLDHKPTDKPYNVKIMVDGGELKSVSQPAGAPGNYSMNFTYTFASATQKTFLLVVDSANAIDESNEGNNQISKSFKPVDPNKTFTGDFDVLPPEIGYRQPFQLKPKHFVFNGCTYNGHRYKIERAGQSVYTSWATSQDEIHSYAYSNYPSVIGIGTHVITLEIRTKECGTEPTATHTLVVNGPANNRPPDFMIGFVLPNNPTKPVYQVVEGTVMHLIYIDDPTVPTPYDPDGDPLQFLGFDFSESSSWAKTIPQQYPEYGDGYHNIVMNGLGYHVVKASMRDAFGAVTTRTTYINVIPKNPIPVIEGPTEVKEGRPLPQPFSSAKSYSPAGRTIDHSKDEWTNKKDVYTTPGKEIITLHVTDSTGLRSLEPARHELTVLPDEPPVAKLEIEPFGIRGQTYYVYNKSYSPDGDRIVSIQYKMRYDDGNNGFDDDPWTEISGNMTRAVFKPDRVGKYQFYVKVCEDYGKCDDTLSEPVEQTMINILNLAPEVSFELEGKNPNPDLSLRRVYMPSEMFGWTLTEVGGSGELIGKRMRWRASVGELIGRTYKKQERFYGTVLPVGMGADIFTPFSDAGYGKNGLNVYRPIRQPDPDITFSQPLLIPDGDRWTYLTLDHKTYKPDFISSPTHLYFSYQGKFYALNKSKFGRYEFRIEYDSSNGGVKETKHLLPDGSYYDYILNWPNLKFYSQVRYPSLRNWTNVPMDFVTENEKEPGVVYQEVMLGDPTAYQVVDDVVYQVVPWMCYCAWDDSSKERVAMRGYTLFTYDLKTGQMIGNGLAKDFELGYPWYSFARNGDAAFIFYESSPGKITYVAKSYDRHLNLTRTKTIYEAISYTNGGYSCSTSFQWDRAYEGVEEDTYLYETDTCYESYTNRVPLKSSIYLVKLDHFFNVVWRTKLEGNDFVSDVLNRYEPVDMIVNPMKNEILTRTYVYFTNYYGNVKYQAVDMGTGALRSIDPKLKFEYAEANFDIDPSGNHVMRSGMAIPMSYTPYGVKFTWNNTSGSNYRAFTWDGTGQTSFGVEGPLWYSGTIAGYAQYIKNAQYVGDGVLLSMLNPSSYMYTGTTWVPWLVIGQPVEGEPQASGMTLGQLLSPGNVKDHEISFTLTLDDADLDRRLAGMSFRAANAANRYAVETDGAVIYLSRYVNGSRTVLAQKNYPFQDGVKVLLKVKFAGDRMELFVNGAPYFQVTDGTYTQGKFGPFSDKSYVRFGTVSTREILPDEILWDAEFAIWEEGSARAEIRYKNIAFIDPENDPPAGSYQWTYVHTPMFIRNQGLSALHNQTFSSGQIYFDKVGLYEVRLSARDDPHPEYRYPSMVFDEYRQPSNVFGKRIIVHRRPVAQFTLSLNADGTVRFNDTSYDPDRWASPTEFSPPEDGKNYQTTRGIFERRYYYITPGGETYTEKLVVPRETGTYTVGMAVKDEYGAWSDWTEQVITIDTLPDPDEPPHAGFTLSHTTTYRGVAVTIDSTAWDKEDGDRTKLPHEYYIAAANGAESLAGTSRTSWTKTFSTIGTFRIRQVVTDSIGQTGQVIQTVTIVNRKPQANVTTPAGTSAANPTKFEVLRPTFVWTYADADGDAQTLHQVQIYRTNGVLERDTGARSGSVTNWTPTADLPEQVVMYVQVRVHDGYEWSDWSAPKYFYIETNRPPVADFDWTPKPVYEGDTVQLIDQSSDPDGDPLMYSWQITGPGGVSLTFATKEPAFRAERPGSYAIRLTVSDGRLTAQANRTLEALPLTIRGEAHHTPEWREKHAAAGHEVEHDPKDFYSGEIIRVAAEISPAPANEVTAELLAVSKTGGTIRKKVTLASAGGLRYEGELHDESWMSPDGGIREGGHTIVFRVVYRNGVIKETSVPIRIIGNIYKAVSVHRVQ